MIDNSLIYYQIRVGLKQLMGMVIDENQKADLQKMYDSYSYPEVEMTDMYECITCKQLKHSTEFPLRTIRVSGNLFQEGRTLKMCQRCSDRNSAKQGLFQSIEKDIAIIELRKCPETSDGYCAYFEKHGSCEKCNEEVYKYNSMLRNEQYKSIPEWIIESKMLVNKFTRKYQEYMKRNKIK